MLAFQKKLKNFQQRTSEKTQTIMISRCDLKIALDHINDHYTEHHTEIPVVFLGYRWKNFSVVLEVAPVPIEDLTYHSAGHVEFHAKSIVSNFQSLIDAYNPLQIVTVGFMHNHPRGFRRLSHTDVDHMYEHLFVQQVDQIFNILTFPVTTDDQIGYFVGHSAKVTEAKITTPKKEFILNFAQRRRIARMQFLKKLHYTISLLQEEGFNVSLQNFLNEFLITIKDPNSEKEVLAHLDEHNIDSISYYFDGPIIKNTLDSLIEDISTIFKRMDESAVSGPLMLSDVDLSVF